MSFTTDDLAAWRARKVPPAPSEPASADVAAPSGAEPIRFTLRELFIAVTVVAALLGLLRVAGIFGAVLAFLATAGFTWILYPRARPKDIHSQRAMFDFLWGVGMPLVCFVYDPIVFKETDDFSPLAFGGPLLPGKVYDHGFVIYAFVGCQMLALSVWLTLGRIGRPWGAFLAGFLASGWLFALLVALALVIPAVIGTLLFGVGLLGLTPLLTAFVYGRQCHRALATKELTPAEPPAAPLAVAGFFASIVVPGLTGLALLAAVRGPDAVARLLQG